MISPSTIAINRLAMVVVAALVGVAANGAPQAITPLPNAHAHNDYAHIRPLFDALDHGFTSVEADVFLVDGNLLVGHDREALKSERTLELLYLAPLAERVRQNRGHVYPTASRFFLLIDIKDEPGPTYRELQKLLAKHADMLTSVEAGNVRPGAVTIVVTGNRPKVDGSNSRVRYVALDGRLSDLGSQAPAHLIAMISDNWKKQFHWNGSGPMPKNESAKLREIVKKAHASNRVVRFWETPENEKVWRELRAAGVDLINTDELDRVAAFLGTSDRKRTGSAE
jgi:glycerophosphoryl diester phosphodiesterase